MYPVKPQHCSLSKRAQFVWMLIPNSGIKMEVCPDVLSLFKRIEPYYQAEPSDIRRLIQRRLKEAYDPIFRHNRKAKQVYFRSGIQRYFAHSKSDTIYSHQSWLNHIEPVRQYLLIKLSYLCLQYSSEKKNNEEDCDIINGNHNDCLYKQLTKRRYE